MPTVFPGGLDNFTNPTPADRLSTPTVLHSTQHANSNDAIEALELKVGVNGSLDTNSLDYKVQRAVTSALTTGRIPQASGSSALVNSNLIGPASNLLTIEASSGSIVVTIPGTGTTVLLGSFRNSGDLYIGNLGTKQSIYLSSDHPSADWRFKSSSALFFGGYRDDYLHIGFNSAESNGHTDTTRAGSGFQIENSYAYGAGDANTDSEFFFNWESPDGITTRRPLQVNVNWASPYYSVLQFKGRSLFYDSAGIAASVDFSEIGTFGFGTPATTTEKFNLSTVGSSTLNVGLFNGFLTSAPVTSYAIRFISDAINNGATSGTNLLYGLDATSRVEALAANSYARYIYGVQGRTYYTSNAPYTASSIGAYAFQAEVPFISGGGTISIGEVIGYNVANQGTNKTPNSYGVRVENQSGANTASYALWTGTGLNRIGDQINLVGSANRSQLIVTGFTTQTNTVVQFLRNDNAVSTVNTVLTVGSNTTGTATNGFGVRQLWTLESSTTSDQSAASVDVSWVDAAHDTRTSKIDFYHVISGALTKNLTLGGGTYVTLGGSFAPKGLVVSSNITLDATHHVVVVTNGSTITLPTAAGISDREYNIIRAGTDNVTINTTSSQTISGDTSLVLINQWDSVVVKAIQISGVDQWIRCS